MIIIYLSTIVGKFEFGGTYITLATGRAAWAPLKRPDGSASVTLVCKSSYILGHSRKMSNNDGYMNPY